MVLFLLWICNVLAHLNLFLVYNSTKQATTTKLFKFSIFQLLRIWRTLFRIRSRASPQEHHLLHHHHHHLHPTQTNHHQLQQQQKTKETLQTLMINSTPMLRFRKIFLMTKTEILTYLIRLSVRVCIIETDG